LALRKLPRVEQISVCARGTQPRWVRLNVLSGTLTSLEIRLGTSGETVRIDGAGAHRVQVTSSPDGGDLYVYAGPTATANQTVVFDDVCVEGP